MFTDRVLQGQTILITGGGSGIGKSLATRVLELGAEIVICGRREEVLGDCITMDGSAALAEGGGGTAQYLPRWSPEQWEEFRTRAARTVALPSDPL